MKSPLNTPPAFPRVEFPSRYTPIPFSLIFVTEDVEATFIFSPFTYTPNGTLAAVSGSEAVTFIFPEDKLIVP